MITLTKAQRQALKRLYDRFPVYYRPVAGGQPAMPKSSPLYADQAPISYREFRKHYVYKGWDCIMVPWCGMYLGIETDGYTHS